MDGWGFGLGIVGICLLWFIVKWLYFDPARREYRMWVRECLSRQAQKPNGTVNVTHGWPVLTIPYKTVNIELSLRENNDESALEYTYARFRTEVFNDKNFKAILDSKDLFQKPMIFGTRLAVLDEKFSEKYIVAGNDASFVNSLLTQEIRDRLLDESLQVAFGRHTDSSTLSRERGWLSVFTKGMRAKDEVLDGLIETAILFYQRLEALNKQRRVAG